jgi:hypothetical protein
MSRPTGVLGVLLALVTCSGVVTVAADADAEGGAAVVAAPAPATGTPAPREPVCAAPAGDTTPAAVTPGATTVHFVVPASTFVRVDAAGAPVAVMTNTLCPPAAGDVVVVVDEAGRAVPGIRLQLAGLTWTGDWSHAGSWHSWPNG